MWTESIIFSDTSSWCLRDVVLAWRSWLCASRPADVSRWPRLVQVKVGSIFRARYSLSPLIPSSSDKVERITIVIFLFYSRNSMPGLTPYRMLDYKEEFLHTDRAPPGKNSGVQFTALSRCSGSANYSAYPLGSQELTQVPTSTLATLTVHQLDILVN